MIHRRYGIATTLALALALTASLAPVASADAQPLARAEAANAATYNPASIVVKPNPDEQTPTDASASSRPCSEVCSGGGYVFANVRPSAVHKSSTANGFDWSIVAIAIGVVVALIGLGIGSTRVAINHSRRRRMTASS